MSTYIEHLPSERSWMTDDDLEIQVNNKTNYEYSSCLEFVDEFGRCIMLPPGIVRECVFEITKTQSKT